MWKHYTQGYGNDTVLMNEEDVDIVEDVVMSVCI
jgi:hypothetical protein